MFTEKIAPRCGSRFWQGCWRWACKGLLGLVPLACSVNAAAQWAPTHHLIDAAGGLSVTDVRNRSDWRAGLPDERWPGVPGAVWFRFSLRDVGTDVPTVVVVPRVFLDSLAVYARASPVDGWQIGRAGDRFLFSNWPLPGPVVAVPVGLTERPAGPVELLVRVQHASAFRDVPSLWTTAAWQTRLALEYVAIGMFIGVALISVFYTAMEAALRQDAVSGWYLMHVLLMTLVVLGQLGYLRYVPGIDDAVLHRGYLAAAGTLVAVATLLFVQRALPQAFGGKTASRMSHATAFVGVCLGALYAVWPQFADEHRLWSARVYFYAATVACVVALLWAARGVRMPMRWWHRAAFCVAAAGVVLYALQAGGHMAGSMAWRQVLPLLVAVEYGLLTYALSLSSRLVADAAPGVARERAVDRSSGFLHVSELPGLLVAMALRAMRVKQAGSVVLLHLSNLAELEAEFGAQIGPSAEQAAIRTLRLALRPGDEVVRLDRTHYVALLHRVHSPEEAREFAMRVQTLGLQYCPELPPLQQIQWHAAVGHMPQHIQRNPEKLPQRLLQLVSQIRQGSAALVRELP